MLPRGGGQGAGGSPGACLGGSDAQAWACWAWSGLTLKDRPHLALSHCARRGMSQPEARAPPCQALSRAPFPARRSAQPPPRGLSGEHSELPCSPGCFPSPRRQGVTPQSPGPVASRLPLAPAASANHPRAPVASSAHPLLVLAAKMGLPDELGTLGAVPRPGGGPSVPWGARGLARFSR